MFELPNLKSFMDNVHGYIRIPKIFVENIIDTYEFQRLRNIDQTGMKVLYPSAKHDRFSHSLGVYHLGDIAVNALLENFQENDHWNIRSDQTNSIYWAKNKVLFLIACLLHDIGHAPFSHSLEFFYGFTNDGTKRKWLSDYLQDDDYTFTQLEEQAFVDSSEHEKMSAYLVLNGTLWEKRLVKILDVLQECGFPKQEVNSDGEYDKEVPYIDSSDVREDLKFIARMILGVKYSHYNPELQMRNCFIELLNGSFDVDKLDYTIRDTEMSGISNTTLDIERLLNALTIIPTTIYDKNTDVDISASENPIIITNFESMENAEIDVSGSFDRKVSIKQCKIDFPENSVGTFYPEKLDAVKGVTRLAGSRVKAKLSSMVKIAGKEKEKGADNIIYIDSKDNPSDLESYLEIRDAEFIDAFSVSFAENFYSLLFNTRKFKEPIKITTKGMGPLKWMDIAFTGTIKGSVNRLEVLSDELSMKRIVPCEKCYTSFSLGFKKQAINLVANVSEARNYLYLWIYSHHKVIYYANYLIVELTRLSLTDINGKTATDIMFDNITDKNGYLLDEDFINQKIREFAKHSADAKYLALFDELMSRVYRTSVYKSLAEFDLRFNDFDDAQKQRIKDHLEEISEMAESGSYGLIKQENLDIMVFNSIRISDIVEDLLWVSSNPSLKRPPASSVYIVFGNKKYQNVTTLDRLPILRFSDYGSNQKYYFYLYYKAKENRTTEFSVRDKGYEVKEIVFQAFLRYMKDNLNKQSE